MVSGKIIERGHGGLVLSNADVLVDLTQRGRWFSIPTNAGWTETNVGVGDATFQPFYMRVDTAGGASASSLATTGIYGLDKLTGGSRFEIDWSKKLRILVTLVWAVGPGTPVAHFQLKDVSTIGALAEKGLGVKILANGSLTGESYGSTLGSVALLTMTASESYQVEIRHYPAIPKVEFWVDGVLKGTQSTSANIPQTLATVAGYLAFSASEGVGGDRMLAEAGGIWIWKER